MSYIAPRSAWIDTAICYLLHLYVIACGCALNAYGVSAVKQLYSAKRIVFF